MAVLSFLSGPAAGLRCEIAAQLTLGRSRACDVALEDDQVSRQHARIEQRQGELKIRDLGSRNGTRVNGRRITSELALLDGDRIQLGASTARVELEPLAASPARAVDLREPIEPPVLVGTTPTFRRVLERVAAAAALNEPVTLFGEAGTGRTLLARYLHAHSPRSGGPLVVVNCSAASEAKESLLGPDGRSDRPSALLRADGGTLVLRHVELLPRTIGQRLARWMLDRPAPAPDGERQIDVRTIALGRDPLEILAAQRRVPKELAEAIAGVAIEVPPLRDRSSDVPGLFNFFAQAHSRYLGREPPRLSAEARRALAAYPWPGNLAELRLVAERLALLCPGLEISVARLSPELAEWKTGGPPLTLSSRVRALERAAIAEALSAAGGKKIRAAQLLGISRPTLDKKLKELHLRWASPLEPEG